MSVMDLFSLKDKVAVVTGASRGLGQAFAVALAEAGAHVVVSSRHAEQLEEVSRQVRQRGREALAVTADITSESQVAEMMGLAGERFGRLDILVNNAATDRSNIPPEETSREAWASVIDQNVNGMFLCAREAGKAMIPRRKGKILNLASMSGMIINKHFHGGSYDVSKSAVIGLTRALAIEWAPYNINVNALAPGYYGTAPNRAYFDSNPELRDKVLDLIPLGRLGTIEELAALAVALCSDAANYMTGSVLVIDGGYTIW
jgi:NAD(P)-dependent dehydrogenase (short-subunit alcohol dehydrogenase family)